MSIRWIYGVVLCASILSVSGCAGGGSEGTGVESEYRSVEGRIVTTEGSPLALAEVTILETGESSLSDASGDFTIQTSSTSDSFDLEIRKDDQSVRTTISSLSSDSQSVRVTIEFDPTVAVVPVETLEVSVKIVGECDPYFENNRTIRQANPVPTGTRCTAKIVTRSGGKPIGNISYGLRYGACPDTSRSVELAAGLTSVVFNPGVGQVTFPFFDDSQHCVYEILVPYKQSGSKPIVYRIVTFTKQAE